MKKVLFTMLLLVIGLSAMAQQSIQLRSTDRAECVSSDMTSLRASFSFSTIEAQDYPSERGTFSWLSLPNTVIGGNEGDPQIPVVNELIAVPFGANPRIEITSYSSTDYCLEDLGIHTLVPRQPDVFKSENSPFVYNEAAYQSTRGLQSEPTARVSVNGTMRGVQVGQMSIEPVSYDPVNNILRVFNNIEVEVHFDGADARATEDMLVKTYSPYFDVLYKQLFNGRAVRDLYDEHPDLWKSPVKMLVIANRMFESCIQEWVAWKTMKGIYVDVNYTDNIGTTASAIKSFIQNKYAQDAPTFLMIMGDKDQVAPSVASASKTNCVADLYYSSVDGDEFVDMFHSRFPAETVAQMTAMLNKALEYEQYTMPDPSYLNNVLLIAGEDSGWGVTVGRPTIWYATNYYYNTEHGFQNVYEYSHGTYTGCYNNLNTGVGFVNYTAHGSNTSWAGPQFTVSDVNNLTNTHKYFLAMGNCCQAADWGISGTCFGEAMVRAENKGAYAYIGSCPSTYWLNDYYFGVGPTNRADGTMPTMEETGTGCYDAIWNDDAYNTVNSILYIGNLAGNAAQALGYELHISTLYYWQAYHVLGDGSIMPYRVQPTANQVSHMAILPIGMATYEVSAVPGSYVAISKDGVLHGTALVGATGTVQVPITPVTSGGDVTICVTAPNRIPYIQTVPAAALEGAYISVDGYTPTEALVGENTNLSITFKNVGAAATTGTTTVTLSTTDANVNILTGTKTFGALAANATITVSGFSFCFNSGIALGSNVVFHYSAVNGSNTWEGNITIAPTQVFTVTVAANNTNYGTVSGGGEFNYGEPCTVTATPADGYMFTNWTLNDEVVSTNATYTFNVTGETDLVANFMEGVMIGDGGTATNNYLPTYNYYKYSLTEQIYTSAELGGAGVITSIAFYNGGAEKTRTLDLYMKNTTKSSFSGNSDWIAVSSSDKVFSGSVTFTADEWTVITFNNPFVYNGTSNVVLVTDDNSGDYTNAPHMSCRVFDATNQAIYVYSDGTNYNPASPSSYSGTRMSQKNQIIITKMAIPTEPVNITVSVSPAQAGTATGGGEYPFGEICTVSVTPNEGYFFTGWTENGVVVSGEQEYSFTATSDRDLVATFVQGIEIGEFTTNNAYLPSYNYYKYSLTQQIYTADEIGAAGTINWIAFYNEGAAKTRTYDFYLKATNKTSFSSKTDWITVAASDKVFTGSVTMAEDTWTIINFTTPFEYDGTSNLVLVVDDNTGGYTTSPHMTCSAFNTNGNQAIYIYNDNTNFNPMSPPASSTNNDVLSMKNHILLGLVSGAPQATVEFEFAEGWNWWAPSVDITLEDFETALGSNGLSIIAQDGSSVTYSTYGWAGSLTSIEVGKMYMVQMGATCTITVVGTVVDPADYPVTLNPGTNWIGFIGTQELSLDEALINFTPTNMDIIKSRTGSAVYYQGRGWRGTVTTMKPGQGYIYNSKALTPQTFNYPSED